MGVLPLLDLEEGGRDRSSVRATRQPIVSPTMLTSSPFSTSGPSIALTFFAKVASVG